MALTSRQKAALLLTTLEPAAATELLKGQSHDVIQEIAMELSRLDASGMGKPEHAVEIGKQFWTDLQKTRAGNINIKSFVSNMLKNTVGKEKVSQMKSQITKVMQEKDPFLTITSATPAQIAAVLEPEPPHVIAIVLSALPPKLSTKVLARLSSEATTQVVCKMSRPGEVPAGIIHRIGEMICGRLAESHTSRDQVETSDEPSQSSTLRKVALLLIGLEPKKRTELLEQIGGNDNEIAGKIKGLMVTWEDIPKIEARSLQTALRTVDAGIMAKAFSGADTAIIEKIRSNISERAAQMVDEEIKLMGTVRKKDILDAREEVLKPLRQANENNELMFIEED